MPTFKDLNATEASLEEFVRKHVDVLFPEGEDLLIVGQQTRNQHGGRADLVAVDGGGNIVLIELKRDAADIAARKESFEFQAIRYAANYARIATPQELVQRLFEPYVEKYKGEHDSMKELTVYEIATRLLTDFLQRNQADKNFNKSQRIVLIASSFDPQTLSACAWLAKNSIDIRCLTFSPIKYGQQHFMTIDQVIPPPLLEQFFVEVAEPTGIPKKTTTAAGQLSRQNLPRMPKIFAWGLLAPNSQVYISGQQNQPATIIDETYVDFQGKKLTFNEWGRAVTKWSAINIYEWTVDATTGKTLDVLRREKLAELAQEELASDTNMDAFSNDPVT